MNKRVSVSDRINKSKKRPVDSLFESTEEKKEVKKDAWELRRQTYYIPEILIDAIGFKKAFEDKDISEIVREALMDTIDEKYIKMAEEKHKE